MVECRGLDGLNKWGEFIKIEDSGWKGENKSSIKKAAPEFQKYYSNLIRLLADKGALSIYFLELNNMPIAGVFGYFDGDIYHYAKIGYDELYRDLSPSNLLILFIIENLTQKYPNVKMFHMFPWDYDYKHRYVNMAAACYKTIIYSKTIRGTSLYMFSKIMERIKHFKL